MTDTTTAPAPEGAAPSAAERGVLLAAELRAAAEREAVLHVLAEDVKNAYQESRKVTQRLLNDARQAAGVERITATLPDGTELAKVSHRKGSAEARITDAQAFTDWVVDHYESEIVRRFVTEVRPAFVKLLLESMTAAGRPEYADPDGGEIHTVPGVEIKPARAQTHSVSFADGGREAVRTAWREGRIPARILPQLTAQAPQEDA